jgi:hypothetical protein
MKKQKTMITLLAGIVTAVVIVYVVSLQVTNARLEQLSSHTETTLAEQQTLLVAIAEATARNGADSVTESVIKDCPANERNQFDDLLSNLNHGLSNTELTTLERLFGRCGAFYAQRKAVMVSRLAREIEVYEYYVEQLSLITGNDQSEIYSIEEWQTLVAEEQKISSLFAELVSLQDEIITSLLAGNSSQSDELSAILLKANEVQETLVVANTQAGMMREQILPL